MDCTQIEQQLIGFLCRNFMVEPHEIILDRSLVDQGIIDSFGLIEISSFIRSTFNISIMQHDMNKENFGSVVKLVKFVERKIFPCQSI